MVENTGNPYRTHQAVAACVLVIAVAVTVLLVGYFELGITMAVGVLLLIAGIAVAVLSHSFSAAPDKFGPSESMFRFAIGALIALAGAAVILAGYGVSVYLVVVVLLLGIAAIGLYATFVGNKTSKY